MFFLPFDRKVNDRIPWMIFLLVAVNLAITFHVYFGFRENRIQAIFDAYGANPSGLRTHAWITHMFLHAGPAHLLGNMAFLILFGMNVERRLGPVAMLGLYFASGFAALAVFVGFNPAFKGPLVGASGAISGVVGMYLILFRKRVVEVLWFAVFVGGIVKLPALVVASFWIGLEVLQAVLLNTAVTVAHWAHVGGFAGGFLLTPLLLKVHRGHPELYAPPGDATREPDRFEEKAYIPEFSPPPAAAGFRLVATVWRPITPRLRGEINGVLPGSGPFATPARVAAGLAEPQAQDLRARLARAGLPVAVLTLDSERPDAPMIFVDEISAGPGGISIRDPRGASRLVPLKSVVRIQAGFAGGKVPILDVVARDPWIRYRLSGATSPGSVEPAARLLASLGFKEAGSLLSGQVERFNSLNDLDEFLRWKLQLEG